MGDRFHPESRCWYGQETTQKESNNIEFEAQEPSPEDIPKKLTFRPLIKIDVCVSGQTVKGVYDSGSNISLINYELARNLKLTVYTLIDPTFEMISGRKVSFLEYPQERVLWLQILYYLTLSG